MTNPPTIQTPARIGWPKAELQAWAEGFSRTPATVLKAFIDAGLCSDQAPQREETRLFAHQPDSALAEVGSELVTVLHGFVLAGCPVCSGDCASANPPVISCPIQNANNAVKKWNRILTALGGHHEPS